MTEPTAPSRDNRREVGRFAKFMVVGAIGAVVDFGTFNLLVGVLRVWSVASSVLSFCTAVTSNFLWNRYWTYPDSRAKPVLQQVAQFLVVSAVGLLVRTPIFAALEKPYARALSGAGVASLSPVPAERLGSNLALATALVIVLFWNFFINRLWTYGDVS